MLLQGRSIGAKIEFSTQPKGLKGDDIISRVFFLRKKNKLVPHMRATKEDVEKKIQLIKDGLLNNNLNAKEKVREEKLMNNFRGFIRGFRNDDIVFRELTTEEYFKVTTRKVTLVSFRDGCNELKRLIRRDKLKKSQKLKLIYTLSVAAQYQQKLCSSCAHPLEEKDLRLNLTTICGSCSFPVDAKCVLSEGHIPVCSMCYKIDALCTTMKSTPGNRKPSQQKFTGKVGPPAGFYKNRGSSESTNETLNLFGFDPKDCQPNFNLMKQPATFSLDNLFEDAPVEIAPNTGNPTMMITRGRSKRAKVEEIEFNQGIDDFLASQNPPQIIDESSSNEASFVAILRKEEKFYATERKLLEIRLLELTKRLKDVKTRENEIQDHLRILNQSQSTVPL